MFIGAIGCEPLQLARVHLENSHSLDVYRQQRRLRGAQESARFDVAGRRHQRSEEVGAARSRRRGISDRDEVELRAEGFAEAEVRRLQRRRIRAGHFQRSLPDGARSAHADRRHADRGLRARREDQLHLHARRVQISDRHHGRRARRSARGRLARQEHSRHQTSPARSTRTPAPALTSAAKRRRC